MGKGDHEGRPYGALYGGGSVCGTVRAWLDGGFTVFSGTDSDDVFDAGYYDLAVADAASVGASGGFDEGR